MANLPSPNPVLPAEASVPPIIPPIRTMPFIDHGTDRLSATAFQFLQQLYTALSRMLTGGESITVSPTPPANPQDGWLWFDTVSGRLFAYYNDGSSSQWVNV
jgi:hypothetical protein